MTRLKRWMGQDQPPALLFGEWLVWHVFRDNAFLNAVERWPDIEF